VLKVVKGLIEDIQVGGPREATFRLGGQTYRLTNSILIRKLLREKKVGDEMEIVLDTRFSTSEPVQICTEKYSET
jgi:hypothetical protein